MRNIQGRHQEVILEEKKMENTVAGPTPGYEGGSAAEPEKMERMRLESKRKRRGEDQYQGRHPDRGPDLWRHLQDETYEQTIQHLQGEDMRNIQGRHQEVILEEKKMENTVAGPTPGYEGGSAAEPEKNGEDEIRE
ncbi:hypothetical protein Bca52824_077334 [Brassica carinata]|uniref:Uncharacterized protein n=1 Tax=Brassica carinata TaxID=52824 RepID=A0A8X7PVP7_BRACI|nr:hypothetical protein Bca52824_077334 [Brassica carinata]